MNAAAPGTSTLSSETTFTDVDQQRFADHSRDRNPMHVSAVAARRTLSGRQVVHGIHTLMHALERYEPRGRVQRLAVSCSFVQPVKVGDTVRFTQVDEERGRSRMLATARDLVCVEVEIDIEASPMADAASDAGTPRLVGELAEPLDEPPEAQQGAAIDLQPWHDGLAEEFPRAAALLGAPALNALARLSYFVGMVCPGTHSLFSSLRFQPAPARHGALQFRVRRWDPRFRLFTVDFDGDIAGELRAFQRPRPQPQPDAAQVAAVVRRGEFAGMRALVIGGSRGLGEVCAKLICGGGGRVCITYAAGRDDAERVAADINTQGQGRCDVAAVDLAGPFDGVPGVDPAAIDCVFYFATPHIYSKRRHVFSRAAFDEFATFYLERFHELCLWLDGAARERPARVFLPSTVFIDERPRGMTEYAMVKAAAELLAADLDRTLDGVRVLCSRLPKLATDQTATIVPQSTASNLEVLLGVVRQMSSAMSSL